jgi:hypothetical protein
VALNPIRRTLALRPEMVPAGWETDPTRSVLANLTGDYTYLTDGYYHSLDLEQAGEQVVPTAAECLDAYVVPIALSKAQGAGIAVPRSQLVTDRFLAPPLMAYPVNPFSSRGELLPDIATIELRRKGLTYTGKYAVLCQALPDDFRIDVVRIVVGTTTVPEYEAFARALWVTFRLPLMKVRVIVVKDAYLLSGIEPLPLRQLAADERRIVEEVGEWHA